MKLNSTLIVIVYMWCALLYYVVDAARPILFITMVSLSALAAYLTAKSGKSKITLRKTMAVFFVFCFVGVVVVGLLNQTFTVFSLYILTIPMMSYYIRNRWLNVKYLKVSFYSMSALFLLYYISNRTFEGMFESMSINYVSVVMIFNISLIYFVQRFKGDKPSIGPAIVAVVFSVMALGRSGMLTSGLILAAVLWANWSTMSIIKRYSLLIFSFIPLVFAVMTYIGTILALVSSSSYLTKFQDQGFESGARERLLEEYIDHMEGANIWLGYNFEEHPEFIHFGLNPHNSYLRGHYRMGVFFFIFLYLMLKGGFKLFKKDKFLAILLLALLLRSWTDMVIFLTPYDLIPFLLVGHGFFYKKQPRSIIIQNSTL